MRHFNRVQCKEPKRFKTCCGTCDACLVPLDKKCPICEKVNRSGKTRFKKTPYMEDTNESTSLNYN